MEIAQKLHQNQDAVDPVARDLDDRKQLARHTSSIVDAYPFNAGTTANDALWMGLPVLTRSGRTFASRMAGALLTALELPELITTTQADYEARAVQLATDAQLLPGLRQRLAANRATSPLFDTPRFVRDFEQAIASVAPVVSA